MSIPPDAGVPLSELPDDPKQRHTVLVDLFGKHYLWMRHFVLSRARTMVSDRELRTTMGLLFRDMKIAVEPACAATTAALLGPLRESLQGKTVVLLFCGSNIDWETFERQAIFEEPAC